MANVSVIIVNWNTQDYLERCLAALYRTENATVKDVWVVDNASSDGSVGMVKAKFPQVCLIENEQNVGFARANNQALRASTADLVLLLNSDAFLEEGCLTRLVAVMQTNPDTGAAGARLLNADHTLQRSCYAFPTLSTELWQTLGFDRLFASSPFFGKFLMTDWAMDDFRVVDVVMGAVMLLRRQTLEQVGHLDESFFMYSEEVDLCYRMAQAGWKVRYVPDAWAVHLWGGSSKKVKAETLLRLYRSRVQLFRKHYGKWTAFLYKGLIVFNSLTRTILGCLVVAFTKNTDLWEKTKGYWRLLSQAPGF